MALERLQPARGLQGGIEGLVGEAVVTLANGGE